MLRLKANKTSLYRLVGQYAKLPKMNKTEFIKAPRHPDYWLKWFDGEFYEAFLVACAGSPLLSVERQDSDGHTITREVYGLNIGDLRQRGMIEDTAATTKCRNCGAEVSQTANFCPHCGFRQHDLCDCWIKKEPYNCGQSKCPGYRLFQMEKHKSNT